MAVIRTSGKHGLTVIQGGGRTDRLEFRTTDTQLRVKMGMEKGLRGLNRRLTPPELDRLEEEVLDELDIDY